MKMNWIWTKGSVMALVLAGSMMAAEAAPRHPKAAVATPRVAKKQANQAARTVEGVKSGQLTQAEVKDVHADHKELKQDKKEAKADGVVTSEERRALRKETRQNSRALYKEKHDDEVRSK